LNSGPLHDGETASATNQFFALMDAEEDESAAL
jgi:hypothetical protein